MIIAFRITNFMKIKQKRFSFTSNLDMNLIHSTKNKNKKSFCIDNEYENQLSTKNGSHLGNCSNTYKMSCALSNTSIKIIITQNICNIFNQIFLVENRFSIAFYSFVFP